MLTHGQLMNVLVDKTTNAVDEELAQTRRESKVKNKRTDRI